MIGFSSYRDKSSPLEEAAFCRSEQKCPGGEGGETVLRLGPSEEGMPQEHVLEHWCGRVGTSDAMEAPIL